MKKIIMDFDTYENELEESRLEGVNLGHLFPSQLRKIHNKLVKSENSLSEWRAVLYEFDQMILDLEKK